MASHVADDGSLVGVAPPANCAPTVLLVTTTAASNVTAELSPDAARQLAYDLLNHADIATDQLLLQQLLHPAN